MSLKSEKIKAAVRAVCFLFIAAIVISILSLICKSTSWNMNRGGVDWYAYRNIMAMKDVPEDEVDVAFFGSSCTKESISTMKFWKDFGIRVQNFGCNSQSMYSTYLMIQEYLRTHSTKVVMLDVLYVFRQSDTIDFRIASDGLPLSHNKITAILDYDKSKNTDSSFSYIVPLAKHHGAWKYLSQRSLEPFIPEKNLRYYYGSQMNLAHPEMAEEWIHFTGWTDTGTEIEEPNEILYEYLKKIIKLCKESGVNLVLYKAPMQGEWTFGKHNLVQQLADSEGIEFLDFHMQNEFMGSGYNYLTDHSDPSHCNMLGAEKISHYLGEYLRDKYSVPDHRGESKYSYMNESLARYERERMFKEIEIEKNMSSYLDLLMKNSGNGYTVLFSVRDNCQAALGENLKNKLRMMGFLSDKVFDEYGHSFIGLWQNGKVLYENRSETIDNRNTDLIEYAGTFPDGMKYHVKSAGFLCGDTSSIVINGTEYSKNVRGFNIVVYDSETGRVIDSVAWDTHINEGLNAIR